jgi:histidyl-tRNA synthetase
MKIPSPKYTRDFYPEDMRRREWIERAWADASLAAGFLPWDGPILETLDLYVRKSGDEIVEQLFNIASKGSQDLAVRPEMTPSLARMIVNRQSALPRPIKWYTIGRMCRYERGQRGRLREFWQWNVDLLGLEGPIADAEVISVALDGLTRLGLSDQDLVVKINSRSLLAALLESIGIEPAQHARVYAVTDKKGKIPQEELEKLYRQIGLVPATLDRLLALMRTQTRDELRDAAGLNDPRLRDEFAKLDQLFSHLDSLGKSTFCEYDLAIVRGLAYYTGPVFEVFDRKGELRAICGGGRYDHLMETMGGQPMPACGFGMGDVVLGELLQERGLSPEPAPVLDAFIVPLDDERLPDVLRIVASLRRQGQRVDYAPRPGNLSKILKRAGDIGARSVLLVGGEEWARGTVKRRDLATREEMELAVESLLHTTDI